MKTSWKKRVAGFTLLEILVVVSIVGILTAVVIGNLGGSNASARDMKRQGDLRNLQSAIETYRNENGRYPSGCRAPGNWSGQQGSSFACGGGSTQYISNLAPKFIPVLPVDPKPVSGASGYVYQTNADGSVYKLKALNTVESETVTYQHPFKPCDIRVASDSDGNLSSGSADAEVVGWCALPDYTSASLPNTCRSNTDEWRISYGVWGGHARLFPNNLTSLAGLNNNQKRIAVRDTTTIICR